MTMNKESNSQAKNAGKPTPAVEKQLKAREKKEEKSTKKQEKDK